MNLNIWGDFQICISVPLMNSNMVKPEKFGHLHLVYHFTVPLNDIMQLWLYVTKIM